MRRNADTLGGVLLCTHDGEVLDGGLRPERAVADGDFAELDGRIRRLEEVLCDVRLQNGRFAVNMSLHRHKVLVRSATRTMYVPA